MIKISRSFSKKIQLKQFEPIDIFCSIEQDNVEEDKFEEVSNKLFEMCTQQVEKDTKDYVGREQKEKDMAELKVLTMQLENAKLLGKSTDELEFKIELLKSKIN